MSVYIHNIACCVPANCYSQSDIMKRVKRLLKPSHRTARYIDSIYQNSDIDFRYSCISNPDEFFKVSPQGQIQIPTTKARNDIFTDAAREMFISVSRKTIESCRDINYDDITDVITVSCTGFFNPGPDFAIIEALNLNKNIRRYNIGFMGCHAAFPALRLANSICRAEPNATVLVVCVELCTIHLQLKNDLDSILGGALFADGAAAAIVSVKQPATGQKACPGEAQRSRAFELKHFESAVIPDSRDKMAWTISNTGFEMILSQYIPRIIQSNIRQIIVPVLEEQGISPADIDHWAVHPGGKAILDKIEESLGIKNKCDASRAVLKQFGNMSSATILFVLKHILENSGSSENETVFAMAFGPGLTVETALLEKIAVSASRRKTAEQTVGQALK